MTTMYGEGHHKKCVYTISLSKREACVVTWKNISEFLERKKRTHKNIIYSPIGFRCTNST